MVGVIQLRLFLWLIMVSAADLCSDILRHLNGNKGVHGRGVALVEIAYNVGCEDSDALE
jgi:hypothetical protein